MGAGFSTNWANGGANNVQAVWGLGWGVGVLKRVYCKEFSGCERAKSDHGHSADPVLSCCGEVSSPAALLFVFAALDQHWHNRKRIL